MIGVTTILGWLNPKRILYLAGAALVAFAVWQGATFISAKYAAERRVQELSTQLEQSKAQVDILRKREAQIKEAQAASDAARDQIDIANTGYEDVRRNASNVKEEDDGPVAPVLRDALRRLDGM